MDIVDFPDFDDDLEFDFISRVSAGMPNAKVFPLFVETIVHCLIRVGEDSYLPVSAIPTTSRPSKAGGQVQAWMGVGSLKPAKED